MFMALLVAAAQEFALWLLVSNGVIPSSLTVTVTNAGEVTSSATAPRFGKTVTDCNSWVLSSMFLTGFCGGTKIAWVSIIFFCLTSQQVAGWQSFSGPHSNTHSLPGFRWCSCKSDKFSYTMQSEINRPGSLLCIECKPEYTKQII